MRVRQYIAAHEHPLLQPLQPHSQGQYIVSMLGVIVLVFSDDLRISHMMHFLRDAELAQGSPHTMTF